MRVLVIGGHGNFGARVCRALAGDPSLQVLAAGRSRGVKIDTTSPTLEVDLRRLDCGLVLHTAGPFQHQGYQVARAAAAVGAHYIDLADGRRFVCDFAAACDPGFRAADRTGISGASTVPALSSAVVEHLSVGWRQLHHIDLCIAPAQTAPRGDATMAAVLGYCGEPIEVWEQGAWQVRAGWAAPEWVHFAHMAPRLGALCDIPDLELFPARYRVTQRVMFRAALEVPMAQRGLALLAWLRERHWLPPPARWAAAFNRLARMFDPFGSALGGMVVRVQGLDAAGHERSRAWHLSADHSHGPEIPCMAMILLARRLARREPVSIGARACVGLLTLQDFAPEFERWGMVQQTVEG